MTSNQVRDLSADNGARVRVGNDHIQSQNNTNNSTHNYNTTSHQRAVAVNHSISNAGPSSITNIHNYGENQSPSQKPQTWDRWDKELFEAARRNDYSRAAHYLAERSPRPDAEAYRDHKGRTSLHWAVKNNNVDMAKLLIDRFGAWKETPQARADRFPADGHPESSPSFLAEKRHTPLFIALWRYECKKADDRRVADYLVSQGCSLTRAAFCAVDEMGARRSGLRQVPVDVTSWCTWMTLQTVFYHIISYCANLPQLLQGNRCFVRYDPTPRKAGTRATHGPSHAIDWKLRQPYLVHCRAVASPVMTFTVLQLCAVRHEQLNWKPSFGTQPLHRHLRSNFDLQTIAAAEVPLIQMMNRYYEIDPTGEKSFLGIDLAKSLADDILEYAKESDLTTLRPFLRELFCVFENEGYTVTRRELEVRARDLGWDARDLGWVMSL